MFEGRSFLAYLLGLNICIILWQIMLEKSTTQLDVENAQHYSYTPKPISPVQVLMENDKIGARHNLDSTKMSKSVNGSSSELTNGKKIMMPEMPNASMSLPAIESSQLIDLHDFAYTLLLPECASHTKALIVVHSAPVNQHKRELIRFTWGGDVLKNTPLRLIFLLGAVAEANLQGLLRTEYIQYGDLLQGSFVDNYRNMTYKHVMAFKWFLSNCAHAQLLIKTDDDVFLNTPQLLKYLEHACSYRSSTPPAPISTWNESESANNYDRLSFDPAESLFRWPRHLLFCKRKAGAVVKRTYRSKWRVSFKDYPSHYYPPYCPGYVIMYSSDIVERLFTAAQLHKYFWIDDVHITGILAQSNGLKITSSEAYELTNDQYDQLLAGQSLLSDMEFIFAWHQISAKQVLALWQLYLASNDLVAPSTEPSLTDEILL